MSVVPLVDIHREREMCVCIIAYVYALYKYIATQRQILYFYKSIPKRKCLTPSAVQPRKSFVHCPDLRQFNCSASFAAHSWMPKIDSRLCGILYLPVLYEKPWLLCDYMLFKIGNIMGCTYRTDAKLIYHLVI